MMKIFAWAQVIAILIVATCIAFEKIQRWRYGRAGKDRRATDHADYQTNGSLKRIEKGLKAVGVSLSKVHRRVDDTVIKIVEIKTILNEQKNHCEKTVARFDRTIMDQNKALLDIASKE